MQKHLGKAKRMGRPSKATLQSKQQVNVRIDPTKLYRLQFKLMKETKHGEPKKTVTWFFDTKIDEYLNE